MGGGGVGGSHGFKERQRDQSIFIEGGSEILFLESKGFKYILSDTTKFLRSLTPAPR